jgi:hypothetical protein
MGMTGEQYFELAADTALDRQYENGLFACPCCEQYTYTEPGGWEICDICGWEDDPVQEKHPGLAGGANEPSLFQARKNYRETRVSNPVKLGRLQKLP